MSCGDSYTSSMHRFVAVLAVASSLVAMPRPASAQYFGRNKVQYESFDFKVLTTPHFDVLFYLEDEGVIEDAARMAERWYERYARLFQHEFRGRKPLILYADHPDFQQTNTLSGRLGEGTGGVIESFKDRVIISLTGSYQDTDRIIGHELVHEFQSDIAQSRSGPGIRGLSNLPLWLSEGLADYLSVGREDPHTAMWLREAVRRDDFPNLGEMATDDRLYTYRFGHALWAFIGGTFGDDLVVDVYRRALRAGLEGALRGVLVTSPERLSVAWRAAVEAEYLPLMAGKEAPGESGALLLAPSTGAGRRNLSPSVSPDGLLVAFLSGRDRFGIDLFVADARTGEIRRKLVSTDVDPHFDALRFVDSQGDWSPDGSRFVFTVSSDGDSQLAIVDVASGAVQEQSDFGEIGSVTSPTWSPDGRSIVFSGLHEGSSNLYRWDLRTGALDQLTDDKYAALQPTWSPDGSTVAFVSDRGSSTDFERLVYGGPHIAFLDVVSGDVSTLNVFGAAKHINPRYAPDGRSLYFVSDQDGFSDIYQYTFDDEDLRRITHLQTGVSGVSAMSPAISVAREAGTIVYSVFDDFEFHVYSLQSNEADAGGEVVTASSDARPGRFLSPGSPVMASRVASYLSDPLLALVPNGTYLSDGTEDYKPVFSLDYTGQPNMGVGTDRFTNYSAGGAAAYVSDLLGNHEVGLTGQVLGHIKDVGGQVHYLNKTKRLNWGFTAGSTPHRQGYVTQGWHDPSNHIRVAISRQHFSLKHTGVILAYPFSSTLRVESNVGLQHLSFELEEDVSLVDGAGLVVHSDRLGVPWLDPVTLGAATVALVRDNATEGYTSPVGGTRFRLEVGRTFGAIDFTSLVADFRGYYSPTSNLTLAARTFHFGRYGKDLDPSQVTAKIQPYFLGYEPLIRGYAFESFDIKECDLVVEPGALARACEGFPRLFGHRLAAANFEIRMTLLGTPEFGLISFPFLPTELYAFADAGLAWNNLANVDFGGSGSERRPVFSTGVGVRSNLLGFLVFEWYVAYPFQRTLKGTHMGFVLSPGW